jgi:hypothetical protein
MKIERGYQREDRLTTHWERQSHGWTHYLWIDPYYVEWGSHRGTPQTDNSQRILHDRLLEGEQQDEIAKEFGSDVLQEVLHTIRHGLEVPRFLEERRGAKTRLEFWTSIPVDLALAVLAAKPDDDGSRYYGNVPHDDGFDETVIRSGNDELHLELWHARFVFDRPRLPSLRSRTVDLDGNHSAALVHGGYFYVADNQIQVFGLNGVEAFSTRDLEPRSGLGTYYRIENVLRSRDRVIAEYHDYQFIPPVRVIGDRGYLEIQPERGIVARCVAEPVSR